MQDVFGTARFTDLKRGEAKAILSFFGSSSFDEEPHALNVALSGCAVQWRQIGSYFSLAALHNVWQLLDGLLHCEFSLVKIIVQKVTCLLLRPLQT